MSDDLRAELARIKERAEAATPGPWERHSVVFREQDSHAVRTVGSRSVVAHTGYGPTGGSCSNNAEFIAHARTDLPRLAAALEAVLDLADGPYTRWVESGPEGGPAMVPAETIRTAIDRALGGDHDHR